MTKAPGKLKLHIVVCVWRGFATEAKVFRKLSDAKRTAHRLAKGRDLREDDVCILTTVLGMASPPGICRWLSGLSAPCSTRQIQPKWPSITRSGNNLFPSTACGKCA